MVYLSTTWNLVYYLAYPILCILSLILSALIIIAAPLLNLGQFFLHTCWYPFHLLEKFETLYIFFGVAVLVGVLTGTSLHYASGFLITILKLESQATEQRERTLATYRAEKLEKLEEAEPLLKLQSEKESETNIDVTLRRELADWTWGKQQQDRRKRGLIPTTILEEEDSSEGGL